jgi:hypothetical protein
MKYCINLTGTPFLRTYLDILPWSLANHFK